MLVPVHAAQRSRAIQKGTHSKTFLFNSFVNSSFADHKVRCVRDSCILWGFTIFIDTFHAKYYTEYKHAKP